jgi:uncharacterized protein (DUF433 family)
MNSESSETLVGGGLYSGVLAARLLRIPSRRIRSWVTARRQIWPARLLPDERKMFFLDFKDLMEVRIVSALRERFSLQKIRRAIQIVKTHYPEETHPLVSGRLQMEGRRYLHVKVNAKLKTVPFVEEVTSGQHAWAELLKLDDVRLALESAMEVLKDVEFDPDGPGMRWIPMPDQAPSVVLDPAYEFGQPIVRRRSVPTAVLVSMLKAYSKVELAQAYEMEVSEIDDAIAFENQFSLAA